MKNQLFITLTLFVSSLLLGCTGMPDKVAPVSPFSIEQYQGKWYEIARLDHSFERGLDNITADYTINDDGSVTVLNRGFNSEENKWSEAQGTAKFVDSNDVGHLKVSFFGPFYSSYIVFKLDQQTYQYEYVSGYNNDNLWRLSRTPTVSEQRLPHFKVLSPQKCFDTHNQTIVKKHKTQGT